MSYSITIRVYQTNPNAFFDVVEQTVWNFANGGTWEDVKGQKVLTMGGSGTSGTLRFKNTEPDAGAGENFVVAVGVHNYKRWCDIVPDVPNNETGVVINPKYYHDWSGRREKQLSSFSTTSATGRKLSIDYTSPDGHNLVANIVIG